MEIRTSPRLPAPRPGGRLALVAIVLVPVTLLVLLPVGLGFERYVMTGDSMSGAVDKGDIAFARVVPVSDLQPGDVITYPTPDPADGHAMETHRVVALRADGVITSADADPRRTTALVPLETPTVARVEFVVPLVGWAFIVLFDPRGWALVVVAAAVLLVLLRRRPRPLRARRDRAAGAAKRASETAGTEAGP